MALRCFRNSIELGNQVGNYFIAKLFELSDEYLTKERSFHFYKIACERGHLISSFKVALEYLKEKKSLESLDIFNKLAEGGCVSSLNNLSYIYLLGDEKNFLKAYQLLNLAASLGSKIAMWNLALMYKNEYTLVKDEKRSTKLFKESGFSEQHEKPEFKLEENLDDLSSNKFSGGFLSDYL